MAADLQPGRLGLDIADEVWDRWRVRYPSFYEPIRCVNESLMIGGDLIAVEEIGDSRWILVYRKESTGFVLASEFHCELTDY